MVAGKLRRLVPSNTLVRKRSESGGKQATHLALAAGGLAGWHWVAWWQPGVACWQPGMACWWPLSEAEPPVSASACRLVLLLLLLQTMLLPYYTRDSHAAGGCWL